MKRTGIKRAAALAMAAVLAAAGALGTHAEESRFGQPEFDLPCKAAVLMGAGQRHGAVCQKPGYPAAGGIYYKGNDAAFDF